MNKEQLTDAITELDTDILDRYFIIKRNLKGFFIGPPHKAFPLAGECLQKPVFGRYFPNSTAGRVVISPIGRSFFAGFTQNR